MANPEELLEAAEAIRDVRRLAAVQRHEPLEDLLQKAEEWARREYCKVSDCLLYTSPSPRDRQKSRMPSSA